MPRATLLLLVLAVLFVLVPFLFWRQTWFGRRLTDRELTQYLGEPGYGRKIQHALVQVSERMVAGDRSARQWYPGLIRASAHSDAAVRNLAAWAMGQDTGSSLLHDGLKSLLADSDLQVRRNAALSLVRFGDPAGRAELVAALRPYEIRTAKGGSLRLLVHQGQDVGAGTKVASTSHNDGGEELAIAPFRAEVAAVFVPDGERVQPGARLISLAPREEDVWEALRALYFVGETADLADVERYTRSGPGTSERVAHQARITALAIRSRPVPSSNR